MFALVMANIVSVSWYYITPKNTKLACILEIQDSQVEVKFDCSSVSHSHWYSKLGCLGENFLVHFAGKCLDWLLTEYFYDWNTGTIYHIIGREIWEIFCLWWTQIVLTSTSSATAFYQIFRDNLLTIGKHIVFALVFLKIEKSQSFLKTSNFSLYLPVMD